jgi:cell division septation protein DedD
MRSSTIVCPSGRSVLSAAALFVTMVVGAPLRGQSSDSVVARAQRLVSSGNGAAGRALIDSVLTATPPGTDAYADALFWKGRLALTAAEAERVFLRLSVEYPLSPRADEALLLLAQYEHARGNHESATRHLQRLMRDYPESKNIVRAGTMVAPMLFEAGDAAGACSALAAARKNVSASDVELANQIEYSASRCAGLAAAPPTPAPKETGATGAAGGSRPAAGRTAARGGSEFSLQVARYTERSQAEAMSKQLGRRGYAARVVGDRAPYFVRVGRYASRPAAIDAASRLRRARINSTVVEAEPR